MKYYIYSKNIITSALFISPLFVLYEFIAYFKFQNSNFVIRNTADIIFRDFIRLFTENVILIQSILILLFFIFYIYLNKEHSKYAFKLKYMPLMYIEGFIYGMILIYFLNGFYIFSKLSILLYEDYILSFYLCLGAGIWEEILFRFILINVIIYCLSFYFKQKLLPLVVAIVVSSVVFSLFHYIGSFADSFTLYSFIIRYLGGVYLSIVYYYRGLGIAMFSHFIYDFILVSYPLI